MTFAVGIYLFDEMEVLDFAGPFEVFSTAARVKSRLQPDAPKLFEVFTLADNQRVVTARGGLKVLPEYTVTQHPAIDVLIIPGGVVKTELQRQDIITWIKQSAEKTIITASVCTGAFLLARAGLLHNQAATTHWEDIAEFKSMFPDIQVKSETRWVDTGKVVSSAGISAGIDMSLHLVERLESLELAIKTARKMEFDWSKEAVQ
jgi:transcriptional regulator GlxA family with amidase domain